MATLRANGEEVGRFRFIETGTLFSFRTNGKILRKANVEGSGWTRCGTFNALKTEEKIQSYRDDSRFEEVR